MSAEIESELNHRLQIWDELKARFDIENVPSGILRELRIYGGQQGIWVDKQRTRTISPNGVTVSLKHSGRHYADELFEDGLNYHYPDTDRLGHDESEIDATKETQKLGLPLFVIIEKKGGLRKVRLAWVENWNDKARIFLIKFGDYPPVPTSLESDDADFAPFDTSERGKHLVKSRPQQYRFKFDVLNRYQVKCAFCDIDVPSVLEAVHLIPKSNDGTDDPRNGLVLCATHHRAFDNGLIGIQPDNLELHFKKSYSAEMLHVKHSSLRHLSNLPHKMALNWVWEDMGWNK